jgi:hypothetical protein
VIDDELLVKTRTNTDLKQTRQQRDDEGYSHNDIPDFVQKK